MTISTEDVSSELDEAFALATATIGATTVRYRARPQLTVPHICGYVCARMYSWQINLRRLPTYEPTLPVHATCNASVFLSRVEHLSAARGSSAHVEGILLPRHTISSSQKVRPSPAPAAPPAPLLPAQNSSLVMAVFNVESPYATSLIGALATIAASTGVPCITGVYTNEVDPAGITALWAQDVAALLAITASDTPDSSGSILGSTAPAATSNGLNSSKPIVTGRSLLCFHSLRPFIGVFRH